MLSAFSNQTLRSRLWVREIEEEKSAVRMHIISHDTVCGH